MSKDITAFTHSPIIENISDHGMVTLSLNHALADTNNVGPGFWKCNVNVLKDEYFIHDFNNLWEILDATECRNAGLGRM